VKAVIFLREGLEAKNEQADAVIRTLTERFSALDWVAVFLGVLVLWIALGAVLYGFFARLLPRARTRGPSNSILESLVGISLFLVVSSPVLRIMESLEFKGIVPRVSATLILQAGTVFFLWAASERRKSGSFTFWDLRKDGFFRIAFAAPVILVAYVPVHLSVVVVWRLCLTGLGVDSRMQEVLLEPLKEGGPSLLVVFASAVAVVPILEEILFRGALYRALKENLGLWQGAFFSAVIFSACHRNAAGFLPLLAFAVLLALAYEWTGSLWASIFLHALFNFANFGLA